MEARRYLGDEAVSDTAGVLIFGGDEFEATWDIVEGDTCIPAADDPMVQCIALPSALKKPEAYPHLTEIRQKELELRHGLANDILSDI